jgi:hypothetical protein
MSDSVSNGSSKNPLLRCVFLNDVLCSFRKSDKFTILDKCSNCPHFTRFEREMGEEDQRIMDEIDEERRSGVQK